MYAAPTWTSTWSGSRRWCGCGVLGTATTASIAQLPQQYEACIGLDADEAAELRAAFPLQPHMDPLPARQRAAVPAPPYTAAQRSVQVEHALAQVICRIDDVHKPSGMGALPACINGPMGAGDWSSLPVALAIRPQLVRPALERDGWLQAHQHELDDWVVSLKYGLVLQRPQYALRGRTSAAHFAQRYMEEYALVRRQHPRPPCRCDRCDGAVAAAGEELLARLHMRMLPVLAGAAPPGTPRSAILRHGPHGTPVSLEDGSGLEAKLHLCAASRRYRPCPAGTVPPPPPPPQQQQQQVGEEDEDDQQEAGGLADAVADELAEEAEEGAGEQLQQAAAPQAVQLRTLADVARRVAPVVSAFLAGEAGCAVGSHAHARHLVCLLRLGLCSLLRIRDHSRQELEEQVLPVLRRDAETAAAALLQQRQAASPQAAAMVVEQQHVAQQAAQQAAAMEAAQQQAAQQAAAMQAAQQAAAMQAAAAAAIVHQQQQHHAIGMSWAGDPNVRGSAAWYAYCDALAEDGFRMI